jgi:rfaE bifunctional protein kinase chain/domain
MSQYRLREIFNSFHRLTALVIGDAMIDAYFKGRVDRISPEAPVPIVAVNKKENRLGGAANVALNVQALGAKPILCTVLGNDADAQLVEDLLNENGLDTSGIVQSNDRMTTVKTRIIGNNHQLIRVDSETIHPLRSEDEARFMERIKSILDSTKIDVIVFEDYDKGVITAALIKWVVQEATRRSIPTTADPKKRNFMEYKGITLFKPNFKELKEGLKLDFLKMELDAIKAAVNQLHQLLGNAHTFTTLSELGVLIQSGMEQHYFSAHLRDITDVSGAGDTVISVASLCLALGENIKTIAELSNLAGGLVCEKVGVVPIDKNQLLQEAISLRIS